MVNKSRRLAVTRGNIDILQGIRSRHVAIFVYRHHWREFWSWVVITAVAAGRVPLQTGRRVGPVRRSAALRRPAKGII